MQIAEAAATATERRADPQVTVLPLRLGVPPGRRPDCLLVVVEHDEHGRRCTRNTDERAARLPRSRGGQQAGTVDGWRECVRVDAVRALYVDQLGGVDPGRQK